MTVFYNILLLFVGFLVFYLLFDDLNRLLKKHKAEGLFKYIMIRIYGAFLVGSSFNYFYSVIWQ